jgi:hypothetical protein
MCDKCNIKVGYMDSAGNSVSLLVYVIRPRHSFLSKCEPRALFLGVNRLKRENDLPLPSKTEVKNAWRYNSVPSCFFMA